MHKDDASQFRFIIQEGLLRDLCPAITDEREEWKICCVNKMKNLLFVQF